MAKNILVNYNFNKNEIQNAVIQPLASAPSSPVEGQFYYNTTDDTVYVRANGAWLDLGVQGGAGATNLGIGYSGTDVTISSDTGDDVTINSADAGNAGVMSMSDWSKLDSIEVGATQNDSDPNLRDRSTHTGTQAASTISDFDTEVSNNTDVAANTAARHTHSNSAVLNATTASYTTADETKVDYLTVTAATDLDTIRTRVNGLDAAVVLMGTWDASAGTFPGGGTAQAGASYIVSVGGTVNGNTFAVNDRILAIADNASTTTYAANWFKLDYTDAVLSVAGQTGAVTLAKTDVGLGNVTNDAQLTIASNLSDVNNAATAFGNIKQAATETTTGVVEYATVSEAEAKTSTAHAVTPAGLASFARKYVGTIGNGSLTALPVTHGLGSQYVTAQVYDATSNEQVECDVTLTSSTTTTFNFAVAPTTNQYRVVITG